MKVYGFLLVMLGLILNGCDRDPGLPSDDSQTGSSFAAEGFAEAYTQEEFGQLSDLKQYEVANKLLSTMFKGIPVDEFFEISGDMRNLTVAQADFISATREALATDLTTEEKAAYASIIDGIDANGNPDPEIAKYRFDEDRPRQLPLARIHEYKLSRDMYIEWMAYFLSNTIMFSPALEMESTGIGDVQNTFRALVSSITEKRSIRQIIRSHLSTVMRWRVSRSPENHALEAYELYLGLFETEEDSRRGGIACREWFLTDGDDGYQLVRSDEVNTIPQIVLENYFITDCNDLYDVIAGHPLVISRVIEVIVNYMMPYRSTEDRFEMIESIANSGPETFEDVFTAIIFSREYLLETERVKTFEESALSFLAKVKWDASHPETAEWVGKDLFRNMSSRRRTWTQQYLGEMGWNAMSYKIGRPIAAPTDALSFANYHKAMRESFMRYSGDRYRHTLLYVDDNQDEPHPWIARMSPQSFLDYLFVLGVQRYPNSDEINDLINQISPVAGGYYWLEDLDGTLVIRDGRHDNIAELVFDYLSRLPEFYYFKTID